MSTTVREGDAMPRPTNEELARRVEALESENAALRSRLDENAT